jgi:RNA polymerase sigma-70 factor, ECF subfamily
MPPDLEVALQRAAGGEEAAVATLYRALNPLLLRYMRHHVGPVAEDVASEVWLGLAPQLAEFTGTFEAFRALMFSVARRRVVDEYRRNGRRPATVSFDETFDCPGSDDTEGQALATLTAQGAVEALARRLPPDQAEIVLLRVLGDLDVEQVAAIVGKSAGAVRVAQHRALERLRRTGQRKSVTQ